MKIIYYCETNIFGILIPTYHYLSDIEIKTDIKKGSRMSNKKK